MKRWLTNLLVRPLTDHLARQVEQVVNQGLTQVNQALLTQQSELGAVAGAVQSLNGAFETYATAVKAGKVV